MHELLEHREALVLVRDERVDLREPAEVDSLAQVVHLVEVLAPPVVDHLEQDLALQVAHQLVAELLLATVIGRKRVLGEGAGQPLAIALLRGIERAHVHIQRPQLLELGLEAAEVPVLEHLARRVRLDVASHDLLEPARAASDMSRPSRISRRYL